MPETQPARMRLQELTVRSGGDAEAKEAKPYPRINDLRQLAFFGVRNRSLISLLRLAGMSGFVSGPEVNSTLQAGTSSRPWRERPPWW